MSLMRVVHKLWFFPVLGIALLLSACAPPPPEYPQNICLIYSQYPHWFWDAEATYRKWGLPEYVLMAVINQESSYDAYAKPPRRHILWIIPWKRISTAKGYSQALNSTWKDYENDEHRSASRTDFADSADFIGWYSHLAYRVDHIPAYDSYEFYLAYHEGLGGYRYRSYIRKMWLIYVAKKVAATSNRYHYQLMQCASRLPQPRSHWLF
jgi:hypothetical protein